MRAYWIAELKIYVARLTKPVSKVLSVIMQQQNGSDSDAG